MAAADLTQRINRITEALERVPDPEARRLAEDLAASILELHGEGLERLLAELDGNQRLRMADDGVVGSLLLIHGLHPVPLEERVTRALEEVRPYMKSHGGDVELVAIEDGVAQLRLKGSCNGCGASSSTLELAVEKALQEAAPDLLGMDVEGAVESRITGTPLPLAPAGSNGDASLPGPRLVGRARGDGRPRGRRDPRRRGVGHAPGGGPRRGKPAGLPRPVRGLRRLAGRSDPERGRAGLPLLRAHVLPAAGRALAGRGAAPARAGAAAGRLPRRSTGGAVVVSGFMSGGDRGQAQAVASLRRLQMRQMPEGPEPIEASCDLCGTSMPEDHRHLLQMDERSLVCVCESCWALRAGDAEYVPTGSRVVPLDLELPDDLWARFRIPIGLAFFLRTGGGTVAFYPSPAGATESELDLEVWEDLVKLNPALDDLLPEAEVLIVDRMAEPHRAADRPHGPGLPAGRAS